MRDPKQRPTAKAVALELSAKLEGLPAEGGGGGGGEPAAKRPKPNVRLLNRRVTIEPGGDY